MAISVGDGGHQPLSEINVTPFVDVMLVLLVIFMVTAPLIQQQVDVELPETSARKSVALKESDLILQIDKERNIKIADISVDYKTLAPKLAEMFKNKTKKEIFLQADKSLPYGFVVKIMAKVKNAGIDRMGMITDSDPEGR